MLCQIVFKRIVRDHSNKNHANHDHSFEFAAVEILNKKKESIYRKTKALKWVSKNKV